MPVVTRNSALNFVPTELPPKNRTPSGYRLFLRDVKLKHEFSSLQLWNSLPQYERDYYDTLSNRMKVCKYKRFSYKTVKAQYEQMLEILKQHGYPQNFWISPFEFHTADSYKYLTIHGFHKVLTSLLVSDIPCNLQVYTVFFLLCKLMFYVESCRPFYNVVCLKMDQFLSQGYDFRPYLENGEMPPYHEVFGDAPPLPPYP